MALETIGSNPIIHPTNSRLRQNFGGVLSINHNRVTGIIRISLKTAIFKSFRHFGFERRQPSCVLNTKNPIKISRFKVEDFLQRGFLDKTRQKRSKSFFGFASILTKYWQKSACKKLVRIISATLILGCRQAVRHSTLTAAFVGSNPATPAKRKKVSSRYLFSFS